MITIKDCIRVIRSGAVFSATVVTFDVARKTGGDLFSFEGVAAKPLPLSGAVGETPITKREVAQNHSDNFSVNIRMVVAGVATDLVRKIHPPLLVRFNNIEVIQ
jgi:hypothetical protein